ncbi:MAG: hypothetical protein KAR87_04420 [Candidatus Aenigmarchaeota archaeon]|nr:hypothetical protein [Candidatus Aenigmarchaeota archaeon]
MIVLFFSLTTVYGVTEEQKEQAIGNGTIWLANQQNPGGSWGLWEQTAYTCFALIKLQDRAYELDFESPFDPNYEYSSNVTAGWNYIFGTDNFSNPLYVHSNTLSNQSHTGGASGTVDNPDSNSNGIGISFDSGIVHHKTYSTGICLMALASSGTPNRTNDGGIDFDGDSNPDTFGQIAQDTADWTAYAQGDLGNDEGGWGYAAINNNVYEATGNWTDNSNSGYAMMGLAAAEGFGCTVPPWVKTELNVWINTIQDPVNGGSWYNPDWNFNPWVNELKTGNLIFEMTYYGDNEGVPRFDYAMDYIARHWNDNNTDPGWRGDMGIDDDGDGLIDEDPLDAIDNDGDGLFNEDRGEKANYQAMFTLMKGFEYSGIELIDLDNDSIAEHDWFDEFAQVILDQQNADGSWSGCPLGNPILCTEWALLTLEKISPPAPKIEVYVDIKPSSCPNPINTKSKGVLPVALLGTEDFDVETIDPATIQLKLNIGDEEFVEPIRWNYEDVATPFEGETCGCHDANGDGFMDLSLKFSTLDVVALGIGDFAGQTIPLVLTGTLKEEYGGTPIEGQDCVWVLDKTKNK